MIRTKSIVFKSAHNHVDEFLVRSVRMSGFVFVTMSYRQRNNIISSHMTGLRACNAVLDVSKTFIWS
jgi:hypothetical protein